MVCDRALVAVQPVHHIDSLKQGKGSTNGA
jgi:hypothetical protein